MEPGRETRFSASSAWNKLQRKKRRDLVSRAETGCCGEEEVAADCGHEEGVAVGCGHEEGVAVGYGHEGGVAGEECAGGCDGLGDNSGCGRIWNMAVGGYLGG